MPFPIPIQNHRLLRANRRLKRASTLFPFLMVMVGMLFLFAACKKEPAVDKELSYPLETARLVSHVTSGVISPDGTIKVRFVSPVIKPNLAGETLDQQVFEFDPDIEGIARWEDPQTLEFIPNRPLPLLETYEGRLDLAVLFPAHEDQKLAPLTFRFQVAGREIANVETDFRLADENDPTHLVLDGTVDFTEKTALDLVKEAASLEREGQRVGLNWRGESPGTRFHFTSEVIERREKESHFLLRIAGKSLELSEDYRKRFTLAPLTDMTVQQIIARDEREQPAILVEFSDDLHPRQDVTGLIAVEPPIPINLKEIGNRVYVNGDFQHGQSYTVNISKGIRSRWGTVSKEAYQQTVSFKDLKPQIKFASGGVFLPGANQRRIRFLTLNVQKVHVEIKRVFESNLGQFLQTEHLNSADDRNQEFNSYFVNRVGVSVYSDSLDVGEERNEWKQQELDLTNLIGTNDRGLYLISIRFHQRDMLYGEPEILDKRSERPYYYGEQYYSNPYSPGYIYAHGRIFKPVSLSDIGLIYQQGYHRHIVYTTHIRDASPIAGVTVTLRSYQNQVIATRNSDAQGYVVFNDTGDQEVFYVEAEKSGQRSIIKLNEMAWNLSAFDTEGEEALPEGTRAFIYTERGVYRPGDAVNIAVIARNQENTFPDNHPVTLRIYNPRNQKLFEHTTQDGREGFYHFTFQSAPEDPTGNWRAEVLVGSSRFYHTLKIETVVPNRLKVNLEAQKTPLTAEDRFLRATLSGSYLFGNPAAGLNAEVMLSLKEAPRTFPGYKGFIFTNETMDYKAVETRIFQGRLDDRGGAQIQWPLPSLEAAPSALLATLEARVFDKGGRPNKGFLSIPVDPYQYYVGIDKPTLDYGYARVGTVLKIPLIVVNTAGEAIAGRPLQYRIYKGLRYWWWEYDTRDEFRLRYKSDQATELYKEGILVSRNAPEILEFLAEEPGSYLVEVQDGNDGHSAGIFLNAYTWGDAFAGGENAGTITLKSDKAKYQVGEQAVVSFPAPKSAKVLLSLERGKEILNTRWFTPNPAETETSVAFPITREMIPTSYVSVCIIQPYEQTLNDRPIRLYGVVPLNIEDPSTRQALRINMPDELHPGERFKVDIETLDHKPTQFTLAVVDEGLLVLTGFSTPDPWQHFFHKLRLGVQTYDLFSQVIGANKGDVFRTFSIGGGLAEAYRESQLPPDRRKRFKLVSLFKGPLTTDEAGRATVEFQMPDYVGAVRVMAVTANGNRYGHADKTVPVKTELMVVPTLPRVLGPEDNIVIPATVFAMEDQIGKVDVGIELQGPLTLQDSARKSIRFDAAGERDVHFRVQAAAAVGAARITITVASAQFRSKHETDIEVRPSSPRIYESEEQTLETGGRIAMTIPDRGIPGSNQARISLRRRPNLNFSRRLLWLIRYPYGCIEQTVSSVFPQLYLKDFLTDIRNPEEAEKDIDQNINAGIRRLRRFQLPSGGFTYWPGNTGLSEWGSNYAGHFLIEAKKLGYSVPEDLYRNWLRFQESQVLSGREKLLVRVYRVYLLALAGEPSLGAMNLLKENNLREMNDTEKWLLAGAYKLAGVDRTARQILENTGMQVKDYQEFGGTYGSGLRDQALILEMLVTFENWHEADRLANELAAALSSQQWYSTQTSAFMLLALGKYLRALEGNNKETPRMVGSITLPDGERIEFDTGDRSVDLELHSGFGKPLEIHLDDSSTVKRAFATLSWNGVPLKSDLRDEQRNLALKVEWLNEDGMPIDPAALAQGATFWGHFSVNSDQSAYRIEEVALLQVLPAGWEIDNIRFSGEDLPGWMKRWNLNREEYLDIRDDRIIWFFDLDRRLKTYDFVVRLNAVTVGKFHMPPTLVEAMYDNRYKATKTWPEVTVK